jgi:uncharacterized DUF497 family protein
MSHLRIEWDEAKARTNLRKHGISFEEAETAFLDDYALVLADPDHSLIDEERMLLIGIGSALRLPVVVHCERESGDIRLISARRATRSERVQYDARWKR